MVVQAAAGATAKGTVIVGKTAVRAGAQAVRMGTSMARTGVQTAGRYAVTTEKGVTGASITRVTAKEGVLREDFKKYANRRREVRQKWENEKKKFFVGGDKKEKEVRLFSYAGALMIAGFKDLLDLALIGSLPGIGTVITFCCNILIFFFLMLGEHKTIRSKPAFLLSTGLVLMSGTMVEGLGFGLNFLPLELGMVIGIYVKEKSGLGSIKGLTHQAVKIGKVVTHV